MKRFVICFLLFSNVFFFSCEKSPTNENNNDLEKDSKKGVYILNQGTWGNANGSLSFYNLNKNKVYNYVFKTANDRDLGDTPNNLLIYNGKIYIIVNGSSVLEILKEEDYTSIKTIDLGEGTAPAFATVSSNCLFITKMYGSCVSIYDIVNQAMESSEITVGSFPEGIISANDKIYVANSGFGSGNTVSVIDPQSRVIIKEISVSDNPRFFARDPDGNLLVLCSGAYNDFANPDDDTPGKIFLISPQTDSVVDSLTIGGHPGKFDIAIDYTGYVATETGILKFDSQNMEISSRDFIEGSFYCVKIQRSTGDIWLADAKDFVSNGEISVYSNDGVLKLNFEVGIAPGDILIVE